MSRKDLLCWLAGLVDWGRCEHCRHWRGLSFGVCRPCREQWRDALHSSMDRLRASLAHLSRGVQP